MLDDLKEFGFEDYDIDLSNLSEENKALLHEFVKNVNSLKSTQK